MARTKRITARAPALTREDGRNLAIAMLRESVDVGADAASLDPDCWPEGALGQNNIVLRYLYAVQQAKNPIMAAGFASVLTDFISSALDGVVPDADFYERQEA